ncbi:MAG: hypothetical protein GWN18_00160 [Thermoplasmata archaeon]|nr:hypothetical protein [Thermoplasmata archaeon]NIS10380.1 hypothetical protein [Thermoplasmata archaeon]NIS18370.1 hypothetical protein [Thermoplasmata archaeon]NIT75345.1 hypothetical protein [Thermoplasmata archaeon]NIU47525.1 hypothetical protein [Thermoplasmata archaeon]
MTDISMRTYDSRYSGMDEGGSLAIGGLTMVGIGVGFTFLPEAPLLFAASILTGIGLGIVLAAGFSKRA